jgi:hypothetical protein
VQICQSSSPKSEFLFLESNMSYGSSALVDKPWSANRKFRTLFVRDTRLAESTKKKTQHFR